MTKPRIKLRRYDAQRFSLRWVCEGDGIRAWGYTPKHAYDCWRVVIVGSGGSAVESNHPWYKPTPDVWILVPVALVVGLFFYFGLIR